MACDITMNKEYLPVLGYKPFTDAATRLLLGPDSQSLKEDRATGIQCLSGTGALRIGADFLVRIAKHSTVYVSNPTWGNFYCYSFIYSTNEQKYILTSTGNHKMIFSDAGFQTYRTYRYWDADKKAIDFEGMMEDLRKAPTKSVVVLQNCAHNPSGVDPTQNQWRQIADLMKVYLNSSKLLLTCSKMNNN